MASGYAFSMCLIFLTVANFVPVQSVTCQKIDSCTCEMSDGSGQINLKTIGDTSGTDAAYTLSGGDGWMYKYNPCYDFNWIYFYNLAVVQTNTDGTFGYDLGTQHSAYFNTSQSGEVSIQYLSGDALRKSRVLLVCDSGTNGHSLEFIGELITTEYDFLLATPCACPGLCNDNGIINPVDEKPTAGLNINVNSDDASSSMMWTDVGGAMVALIFHDLLLVVVIASVVFMVKSRGGCANTPPPQGFSPNDITGQQIPGPHNVYKNAT